jgi:hypothetical protein
MNHVFWALYVHHHHTHQEGDSVDTCPHALHQRPYNLDVTKGSICAPSCPRPARSHEVAGSISARSSLERTTVYERAWPLLPKVPHILRDLIAL